jgi:hypothetical protein
MTRASSTNYATRLYVDPPAHAIEKARFMRSTAPPGLPLKKGRAGTMTHD